MADVGFRDLGSFVPGRRTREPAAPSLDKVPPAPVAESPVIITPPPPPAPAPRQVFGGDLATGADVLGIDATLAHLAELVAHKGTAAPLCIGLLGGPGSGKSFALNRLSARIRDLAAAAKAERVSPYLSQVHVQAIDAASLDADPALGLAAQIHAGLRTAYPALAREIGQTARDPHIVLREANEKLDDARRRLDSERRALDDAGSRRARLIETVLYEAAGSQVDAYARANRPGIESRFASFGIAGDAIRNYKDLVQLVAGSGGKVGLSLRALWAYKGQARLIVFAILLIAVGIGLGIAIDDQSTWLEELRTNGQKAGTSVASWFQTHMGLFSTAQTGAYALAIVCLLANGWRAFSFLAPIFKGTKLLGNDLDARRRDLDSLVAHQTKRVDTLDADVERLSREVAEAERRSDGQGPAPSSREPSPFEEAKANQAKNLFVALGAAITVARDGSAPQRIVLAIDHLDAVPGERARAILDTLHRIAGSGIVRIVAADPNRLHEDVGRGGNHDLDRWVQIPLRLDSNRHDAGALAQAALGKAQSDAPRPSLDAKVSALDEPIGDAEADAVTLLAELAAHSPRAVKRFVNLYTLARLDSDAHRGALALMLAVGQGGNATEKNAVADAMTKGQANARFAIEQASPRLAAALNAVVAAGGAFSTAEAATAARRAALFSAG